MTALFYSYVCDYCDGLLNDRELEEGFVVWRARPLPSTEYVFQKREHAERYRAAVGLETCPIKVVRSPFRFSWRRSTGSLDDIITHDKLVTIYPDDNFQPAKDRAYVCAEPG